MSTNSNNPIEPSQQVDSIAAKDDQPEKDFDDSGSQHSNADVQIQAHRKRHRQQQTKLFGGAGVLAIITLLMVVAYYLFTSESAKQGETTVAQPEVPMSALEISQFREAFKQALTQYEINVQPNIDEIMMSDWQPQKASELALIKNQALTAFAQGAFAQANQTISTLLQRSTALFVNWQKQIEQYINDGQEAFDHGKARDRAR